MSSPFTPSGGMFGLGIQLMRDGQQRFTRSGFQTFLRVQNFPSSGDFQEVGGVLAISGVGPTNSGYTDIFIDPPPDVVDLSIHNIGMSGGKLMEGAKEFRISHTFVERMMAQYPAILDAYNVFRDWDGGINQTGQQTASTIGIIYADRLYSIESIIPKVTGGRTVLWIIRGNFNELELASPAAEVREP